MILGEVASSGAAKGVAVLCTCSQAPIILRKDVAESDIEQEIRKLDTAISEAEKDLIDLQRTVQLNVGSSEAKILEAHILLLRDFSLRNEIVTRCLMEKINVEAALDDSIKKLGSRWAGLKDSLLRERSADLFDVGQRLLQILTGSKEQRLGVMPIESILVTRELLPSIAAQLDHSMIKGLVVEQGAQTAHAIILARSKGIPSMIHVPDATNRIKTGDTLILDALAGRLFVNPSSAVLNEYERLEKALNIHKNSLKGLIDLPVQTKDDVKINLCANIGKVADAATVTDLNADGIGLYRTEFVFHTQDHFPSEQEQYQLYHTTMEYMKQRPAVIRILDLGSDKLLPYFSLPHEDNPSLGRRGMRLLLIHPEVLRTQLRAILRLSAAYPVSILFPMIGSVEEYRHAKGIVESVKQELACERQSFNQSIPVGAMIETPSAAIMARKLAQEADFLSIGTNDLVQYLLTVDRTSADVASYYEPLHPAVLQMLKLIADAAKAENKNFSICGEMAGNPAHIEILLGLGFRGFSVAPGEILEIKNVIRSTSIGRCETLAKRILEMDTVQEIKAFLRTSKNKGHEKNP